MPMPLLNLEASAVLKAAMHVAYAGELRDRADDPGDKESFSDAVMRALDVFSVSPAALSQKFGVTKATVSRWRNGAAEPGAYMKREILLWLAEQVENAAPVDAMAERVQDLVILARRR